MSSNTFTTSRFRSVLTTFGCVLTAGLPCHGRFFTSSWPRCPSRDPSPFVSVGARCDSRCEDPDSRQASPFAPGSPPLLPIAHLFVLGLLPTSPVGAHG